MRSFKSNTTLLKLIFERAPDTFVPPQLIGWIVEMRQDEYFCIIRSASL